MCLPAFLDEWERRLIEIRQTNIQTPTNGADSGDVTGSAGSANSKGAGVAGVTAMPVVAAAGMVMAGAAMVL